MSIRADIMNRQKEWALSVGLKPDNRGYLDAIGNNLFRPMSEIAISGLSHGSGSELVDSKGVPAKIKALHSSSALVLNVFDYFISHSKIPLADSLGIDVGISGLSFEEQFSTGLSGTPPNIDVALTLADGYMVAIESKFTEWMVAKSGKQPFATSYFPPGRSLWDERSLKRSQQLALRIQNGEEVFCHLDANQLLKHALGLAAQLGDRFSLLYLYFDWPGRESVKHNSEIEHFKFCVGKELRFQPISYQQLFSKLRVSSLVNISYLDYLSARYF